MAGPFHQFGQKEFGLKAHFSLCFFFFFQYVGLTTSIKFPFNLKILTIVKIFHSFYHLLNFKLYLELNPKNLIFRNFKFRNTNNVAFIFPLEFSKFSIRNYTCIRNNFR